MTMTSIDSVCACLTCRWFGVCQPYNGSVCRDQLQGKAVYHNVTRESASHLDEGSGQRVYVSDHEEVMRRLLAEMRDSGIFTTTEGRMDEYCLGPALELMCHYAFPDCRLTQSGYVMPVPICR